MSFKHCTLTRVLAVHNLGFANLALQFFAEQARNTFMGKRASVDLQPTRHGIDRGAEFFSGLRHSPKE